MSKLNIWQKTFSLEYIVQHPGSDAIQVMRHVNKLTEDSIDWHEYSYYLDELHTKGVLVVTGHQFDGMTQYKISTEEVK